MAIIITCDQCGKRMGSLEPHGVKDDKYLCLKCVADKDDNKEDIIALFYKTVNLRNINDFNY